MRVPRSCFLRSTHSIIMIFIMHVKIGMLARFGQQLFPALDVCRLVALDAGGAAALAASSGSLDAAGSGACMHAMQAHHAS